MIVFRKQGGTVSIGNKIFLLELYGLYITRIHTGSRRWRGTLMVKSDNLRPCVTKQSIRTGEANLFIIVVVDE